MEPVNTHNTQVIDQFSLQAEGYGRLTSSIKSDRSAAFRALVAPSTEDLLLDVCCGTGSLTLELAPYVCRATGLDLTPAMLDQARAIQEKKNIVNAYWMAGDAERLPFDAKSFSLVVCSAAFHHLLRPRDVLAEMVRVCRSGGRIAVRDVSPAPEKASNYDAMERLRDPSHVHALTVDELLELGSGLKVGVPQIQRSVAADLSLAAVLATSFPGTCSTEQIAGMFREDAESGANKFGFDAKIIDGEVHVSYPMAAIMWPRL